MSRSSTRARFSRADAYAAFFRASRFRLVHAVYAFCGDTEVAQRAVADAFVAAGHHWRKVSALAAEDREAWVRDRAMRYASRGHRGLQPWYVRALKTDDRHRTLLSALRSLPTTDRRLLIAAQLVGRELSAAAREAGLTDDAARRSLERSSRQLAAAGLESSPRGLAAALDSLRHDLVDEVAARPHRLRREGNRRRRSHMGLVALCSVAAVIGAGALTAAQTSPVVSPVPRSPAPPSAAAPTTTPVVPDPVPDPDPDPDPPAPELTTRALAPVAAVASLQGPARWKLARTSADFGTSQPYDDCLTVVPSDQRATHFFTRRFTAGSGEGRRSAVQAMEMSRSEAAADRSYSRLVATFGACPAPSHNVAAFRVVRGIGNAAALVTLRYLHRGSVFERSVALARTGLTVVTWVVDTRRATPATPRELMGLLATSVQRTCDGSLGRCSRRPFVAIPEEPPRGKSPKGFLTTTDLPLFAGLSRPWVATTPRRARVNPAATDCDRADFTAAGATLRARTYVVPDAPGLDPIFGMTEARAEFARVRDAEAFLDRVADDVAGCHDRQISLEVRSAGTVPVENGRGRTWRITLVASENRAVTFHVAVFRVGRTVGQLTFTPTQRFDLSEQQYADLARRAAQRLDGS